MNRYLVERLQISVADYRAREAKRDQIDMNGMTNTFVHFQSYSNIYSLASTTLVILDSYNVLSTAVCSGVARALPFGEEPV